MAKDKLTEQPIQARWGLRNIDVTTIRKIKAYAAVNGIEIAEALKHIVREWEALKAQDNPHDKANEKA